MLPYPFGFLASDSDESLLLDDYPVGTLGAAWSFRLLSSTYTGDCIRVRRSSDDVEADIGFSGGVLDETALLAHVGTGGTDNGFITTWYEQSGNTATTAYPFDLQMWITGYQPKIVSAGVVEKLNGKPTMVPQAATFTWLQYRGSYGVLDGSYPKAQPISIFMTGNYDTAQLPTGHPKMAWDTGSSAGIWQNWGVWQWGMPAYGGGSPIVITGLPNGPQVLVTSIFDSPAGETDSYLYVNGTVDTAANGVDAGNQTWSRMFVMMNNSNAEWDGTMQEFIIYDDSVLADKANIEADINGFYSIY